MIILRGTTDYKVIDYSIEEKIGEYKICKIKTLASYFYNFLNENKRLYLIKNNKIVFIGIIDTMDYNFEEGVLSLVLYDYIVSIKYKNDLLGDAPSYVVTYSASLSDNILSDILSGTEFTMEYCPSQSIDSITGDRLDRSEWLMLLKQNITCGLDINGNYTTNASNIVSDEQEVDILTNYTDMTVTMGVAGCYRESKTSEVWKKLKLKIDDYIDKIDELQYNIHDYKRIIVVGKNDVYGSAYLYSALDLPVKVIVDTSCETSTACVKKANTELNKIYKEKTIGLTVKPELYYNNEIQLGMSVVTERPIIIGEYTVTEIKATSTSVSLTLGRPKKRFITSLYDIEKRVSKMEKW